MNEHIKNRKRLIICLSILGVVTLSIIAFLFYIRLENPLFLKNYSAHSWDTDEEDMPGLLNKEFTIQYLSNTDDSRVVTGIDFPDFKDEEISFNADESESDDVSIDFLFPGQGGEQSSTVPKVGFYSLHTVRILVQCPFSADEKEDTGIILRNALVRFNDDSTQEIDLGEIKLYWRDWGSKEPLSDIESMASNDGISEATLRSKENLTVLGLRWMPDIDSAELFKSTLNGVDASSDEIKGMNIKKGEKVTLRTKFPEPKDLENKFTVFWLRPVLAVQDSKGVQKEIVVDLISYEPSFSSTWDILRYALAQ